MPYGCQPESKEARKRTHGPARLQCVHLERHRHAELLLEDAPDGGLRIRRRRLQLRLPAQPRCGRRALVLRAPGSHISYLAGAHWDPDDLLGVVMARVVAHVTFLRSRATAACFGAVAWLPQV